MPPYCIQGFNHEPHDSQFSVWEVFGGFTPLLSFSGTGWWPRLDSNQQSRCVPCRDDLHADTNFIRGLHFVYAHTGLVSPARHVHRPTYRADPFHPVNHRSHLYRCLGSGDSQMKVLNLPHLLLGVSTKLILIQLLLHAHPCISSHFNRRSICLLLRLPCLGNRIERFDLPIRRRNYYQRRPLDEWGYLLVYIGWDVHPPAFYMSYG